MEQDNIRHLRLTNSLLQDALEKRKKFLEEHPELVEFQDEIDEVLEHAGSNIHNREAALRRAFRVLALELQIEALNAQDLCNSICK